MKSAVIQEMHPLWLLLFAILWQPNKYRYLGASSTNRNVFHWCFIWMQINSHIIHSQSNPRFLLQTSFFYLLFCSVEDHSLPWPYASTDFQNHWELDYSGHSANLILSCIYVKKTDRFFSHREMSGEKWGKCNYS